MIRTLGCDPSLAHGVVILGEWERDGAEVSLKDSEVLFSWGKRKSDWPPLTRDSGPEEIQRLGSEIVLNSLASLEKRGIGASECPMGLDWEPNAVMWKGQSVSAGKVSFLAGYLIRGFQGFGLPVAVITPREVRGRLGLSQKAEKKEVWSRLRFTASNSDYRDGLLLSYLVAQTRMSKVNVVRKDAQTPLPGF